MIPQYNITGQSVTPQEIVDIIPEQEKSDREIQLNEERYFQQLKAQGEEKLRNDQKMWEGLSNLSSTIGDVIKKRQEKHRADREAEISLDILTRGVSPELEARFKGERDLLFEDDLATQEFASKYESETGDSITAQEFRNMAGWEKYMVAEQYALQKAKGYDKYVYDAYETTKIDVIRNGQQVSVGHLDNLSPAEQAALDTKIKFEYAKQFAGLNPALVATVVKPEIDKFDEKRRKEQAVKRETAYQIQVKESDSKMIEIGFATANPEDGHQLAHDWAARYAARNQVSIQAGRIAFKENLIDLVSNNKISYPEAMSIVNHEITARDGSMKTMSSWKEWEGLPGELADAAKLGADAREEEKEAQIVADVETIRSLGTLSNDQKIQMMGIYKEKYGYVPSKLSGALAGHIDDSEAENMIQESIRYQGGVYDFELANVSTAIYNKYKDKLITAGATVPGTDDHKRAAEYIKSYTNEGTESTFGENDIKSPQWLRLNENLTELFNKTYKNTYIRNGQVVSTPEQAMEAGLNAVQRAIQNPQTLKLYMQTDFSDDGDETYHRMMIGSMQESSSGKWKTQKITTNEEIDKALVAWHGSTLRQAKGIPSYYRDLAMRIGVNPIDLANAQVRFLVPDAKIDKQEEKYNQEILNLIYKFPTRGRITRARLLSEGAGDQNAKTSIYNKKALMIKDE
jgi:hypothetical protein